jgi:phytoene dehydrogenase-like protein
LDDPTLIPAELKGRIEKASVSEGFFTVYLGLGLTNGELERLMKRPFVLYMDEKPGADVQNADDVKYFEKTGFTLFSPSLMSPENAPEGKSSLMIQAITPYKWMNNWGGGDRALYQDLKSGVQQTLIHRAEQVVPGLRGAIELADSATPLTYERYTQNTDGATSAWSWNPNRRFYKDMWSTHVETPVKNLLIGSCWATQIGGIPGALSAACRCAKLIS